MATPEELDALRKKVAANDAARATKLQAVADAIEQKILEEKLVLAGLEDTHGTLGQDIEAIFSPKDGRMIVVKTPSAAAFQVFQNRVLSNKPLTTQGMVELIYPCLVYPDKKGFEDINDAAPGIMALVAGAVAKLAGASKEDAEGK